MFNCYLNRRHITRQCIFSPYIFRPYMYRRHISLPKLFEAPSIKLFSSARPILKQDDIASALKRNVTFADPIDDKCNIYIVDTFSLSFVSVVSFFIGYNLRNIIDSK